MYKRHDLLWLNAEGREAALRTARPLLADATDEQVAALLRNTAVPAIVSRQEERRDGVLEAGFASPEKYDGSRLRVAALVRLDAVEKTATPFQVAGRIADAENFPRHSLLRALIDGAARCGLDAGFFGSTALQMATGLAYCDETSDVDVYVRKRDGTADVRGLYDTVMRLEQESGMRIDVEFEFREVFGVKLKEMFAGRKMVLAKGLYSVELFPADAVG